MPRAGREPAVAGTVASAPARVTRLTRHRLSDQLVIELLSDIVSNRYPPGTPFASEGEMVERFSVSRVVARESLRMLGSLHVVAAQQGRRAVVLPPEDWDLFSPQIAHAFQDVEPPYALRLQLYDTRSVVESGAAALCATNATPEQLDHVGERAQRLSELSGRRGDVARFLELDREFHEAVAAGSGNAPLKALLRSLFSLTLRQWRPGGTGLRRQSLPMVAEQHQRVADAIAIRDVAAARQAMEQHIAWAKANDT